MHPCGVVICWSKCVACVSVSDCTQIATGKGFTCPRTYWGGCGNWKDKTLNKNFTDKRYTVSECAYKCKTTSGCGGFFLHTKTFACLLAKPGCYDDNNNDYGYYAMDSCKVADCGAPPVDWANVLDDKAPAGWHVKGFNGNVGDAKQCKNGWNAYANGGSQGELYATMTGSGRATVQYRDCWSQGFVGLYVNGVKKDQSGTNNGQLRTYRWFTQSSRLSIALSHAAVMQSNTTLNPPSFDFKNGDVLKFKDEGKNAVIQIVSINYQCHVKKKRKIS